MGWVYLFMPLFLLLFFAPVPIIYFVFERKGRKNFWKFTALIAALYLALNWWIFSKL